MKNIKQTAKKTALHVGGCTLDIPKDNLVLLRDHPEGRQKIQNNYKSELFVTVSKHKVPNVYMLHPVCGVQCIWSIDDNCLTLKNHPLGIVGIPIPQIHPLKLIYPFYQPKKIKQDDTPHQLPYGTRSKTWTNTILQSPDIDENGDVGLGLDHL